MQNFLFLSLLLIVKFTTAVQNRSKELRSLKPPSPALQVTLGWGDSCKENCTPESHTICRNFTCVCDSSTPVYLKKVNKCSKAILLGGECEFDEECIHSDKFAFCREFTNDFRECDCKKDYEIKEIVGLKPPRSCYPGVEITEKDVPTFLGFGLGLSLMSAMICLALRIYARARFARPRGYANAAIPPPLTVSATTDSILMTNRKGSRGAASDSGLYVTSPRGTLTPLRGLPQVGKSNPYLLLSQKIPRHTSLPGDRRETYAAFALSRGEDGTVTPVEYRPISIRSASSSRRPSYISMQQHRPSGNLYRLGSSSSISANKTGSRRQSAASVKSFRSQSGLLLSDLQPQPDHYIVYMIRGPSRSLPSDSTTVTTCDSASPRSSTDQQHSPLERCAVGKSHTTSSFRTISSEDIFEEEDENLEDDDQDTDDNRV